MFCLDNTRIYLRRGQVQSRNTAIFVCDSTTPPTWMHNGKMISRGKYVLLEKNALMLLRATIKDEGLYDCEGNANDLQFKARIFFSVRGS